MNFTSIGGCRKTTAYFACVLGVLLVCIRTAQPAVLSGSIIFSANPSGQAGQNVWDTRSEGGWLNLFFATPSTNGLVFLNGPDNSHASINILLRPGTNRFTVYPEGNLNLSYNFYGANLFFDGHTLPDISAKGSVGSDMFTTNAAWTLAMDGTGATASGKLEYYNGTETVTLIECSWGSPTGPGNIVLV